MLFSTRFSSESHGDSGSSAQTISSIIVIMVLMIVVTTTVSYEAIQNFGLSGPANSGVIGTANAPAVLKWGSSTAYPIEVWTQSCVLSGGYVYCVGGLSASNLATSAVDGVYYAPISSAGIGTWANTTDYPTSIRTASCVAEADTIYCVGGYSNSALTDDVYYAPLSPLGVGSWTNTTSYPFPVWSTSCVASITGIYCVGGGTSNSSALSSTSSVYFAPFSSSGLGQWTPTSDYPVMVKQQSCAASATDLYCVGGYDATAVYYAPLESSGVGTWAATTGYPFTVGANLLSCVIIGDSIYCVGGHTGPNVSADVYSAQISTSGLRQWASDTSYPVAVWGESCVASADQIYCVGGETASGDTINEVSFSSPP